jgi:hypothetical protein
MGNVPYRGRGSTVEAACLDLEDQLKKHISTNASVRISQPIQEAPLSPRKASPRYAGPFVAMAVLHDGKDHNVILSRDISKNEYYASVSLK